MHFSNLFSYNNSHNLVEVCLTFLLLEGEIKSFTEKQNMTENVFKILQIYKQTLMK